MLEAFFMHALIRDRELTNSPLRLPHRGLKASRLDQALQERNLKIVGTGQKHWAHACHACCKFKTSATGQRCECIYLAIFRLMDTTQIESVHALLMEST